MVVDEERSYQQHKGVVVGPVESLSPHLLILSDSKIIWRRHCAATAEEDRRWVPGWQSHPNKSGHHSSFLQNIYTEASRDIRTPPRGLIFSATTNCTPGRINHFLSRVLCSAAVITSVVLLVHVRLIVPRAGAFIILRLCLFWLLPIQSSNPPIHHCFARSHFWNIDVNLGRLQTSIVARSNTDQQIRIRWFHTLSSFKGRLKGPMDFLLVIYVLADPWILEFKFHGELKVDKENAIKTGQSNMKNKLHTRKSCTQQFFIFCFCSILLNNKEEMGK